MQTEQKQTNLNSLFIDQIINFAHLITVEKQTKEEFLSKVSSSYNITNTKTLLFCLSIEKSIFENICLSPNKQTVLFNT